MLFPMKKYERLGRLQRLWQVPQEDVYYAVENGLLKTSIWLPLRYVERGAIKNRKFIYEAHEHLEGFVGIRPEDSRIIFNKGRAKLRMFNSVTDERHLRLAYEPPQPSISVRISDLIVLQKHREEFETAYEVTAKPKSCKPSNIFQPSPDYRYIRMNGEEFHLGDVQARVIEQLHDASQSHQPWVHGKTLIYESGSQAIRLRDLFKNRRTWRGLIISNERGYYRLNAPAEQTALKSSEASS
jgi:hypothetical protein